MMKLPMTEKERTAAVWVTNPWWEQRWVSWTFRCLGVAAIIFSIGACEYVRARGQAYLTLAQYCEVERDR